MILKKISSKINLDYSSWNIQSKIGIWFIAIFAFVSAVVVINQQSKTSQSEFAHCINAAGRQRMLSQRIARYGALVQANPENEVYSTKLKGAIKLHMTTLEALKNGGLVYGFGDPIKISHFTNKQIEVTLEDIESIWTPFRKHASIVAQGEGTLDNTQYLADNADALLKANNNLVKNFVQLSGEIQTAYSYWIIGLLLATLGAVIAASISIRKLIISSIRTLSCLSKKLATGDINTQIKLNQKDELGALAGNMQNFLNLLRDASEFASEIGEGKFDSNFNQKSEEDVLGNSLVIMRDRLKDVADKDQLRNWGVQGQAQFSEILRMNTDDMNELGKNIVRNLVQYLGVDQGGIFVVSEENHEEVLRLIGCYAYDRDKFFEKTIRKGEGLVGECWQEGKYVHMKKLPKGYLSINSGLGEESPNALIIVPLKMNDEILGVIELASLRPFEDHEIEFVLKLGESIAATLSSAKINAKTSELLTESQRMQENLQAQEEEMRQNMEEMQATQESMKTNEDIYKKQISDLQKEISQLKSDK